jgi:hypothetical protein
MPYYNDFIKTSYIQEELTQQNIINTYEEATQETPPPQPTPPYMDSTVYDPAGKEQQVICDSDVSDLGVVAKIVKTQPSGKLPPIDGSLLTDISLNQLSDVVLTAPSSGQVVKFDGVNWINDTDAGGGGALSSLTDTNIITPLDNQSLKFDTATSKWVNESVSYTELTNVPSSFTPSAHTLDSHSNVVITAVADKNALIWDNATSKWVNNFIDYSNVANKPSTFTPSTHSHLLGDLTDFNINTPLDNQAIKFDTATSKWVNESVSYTELTNVPSSFTPSAHTLDSHSNVVITAVADKNALIWDNATSKWVNNFIDYSNVANKPSTFTPSAHTLDSHSNVVITAVANNDVVKWDNATTKWINGPAPAGAINDLSDVVITTPVEGDYLYYNGSDWVNRTFLHSSLKNTANFSFSLSNGNDTQFPNTGSPVLTSAVLITNTGGTMTSTVASNAGARVCLINVNMSCRITNNADFYLKIWKTGVVLPEYLFLNLSGNVSTEMSMTSVTTLNNNDTVYITVHAAANTTFICNNNQCVITITEI